MAEPSTRADLLASYERPYARWMPSLYAINRVREALAAVAALWVAEGVWSLAGDAPGIVLALAIISTVVWIVWAAWVSVGGLAVIRDRTAEWRARDRSDLARVRERRPHAAEADREVAHAEFAVSVADGGELVTWSFTPLASWEEPAAGEQLLVGTPRHAARPVARTRHDARDAGLAAEQLAAAQEDAADRERAAAAEVHAALATAAEARELADETASTGVALRRVTGQGPR